MTSITAVPDRAILAYYDAIAPKILPFLKDRRVAVRHHFDTAIVFRRHEHVGKKKVWITIETKEKLLALVHQHGYEFFPHLEGDCDFWFALDIDIRAVPLELGKLVVRETTRVLEERRVKFLLSFSGGNGFHIRWAFPQLTARDVPKGPWPFLRGVVRNLQQEVERRLQRSTRRDAFYRHIPRGDPITELNAMDKRAQKSVLFDELILKPTATIRAPFSLHMGKRLVAVPLSPHALPAFLPERHATPAAARKLRAVRIPKSSVATFLDHPLWRG